MSQVETDVQAVQIEHVKRKRNLSDDARKKLSEAAKTSTWALHLKSFREAHPDVKGKAVFSEAAKTYQRPEKKTA